MKKLINITLILIISIISLLVIILLGSNIFSNLIGAFVLILILSTPFLYLFFLARITTNSKTLIFIGILALITGAANIWAFIIEMPHIGYDAMAGFVIVLSLIAQIATLAVATVPILLTRK